MSKTTDILFCLDINPLIWNFKIQIGTSSKLAASQYYKILGIDPKASQKEIKSAYYQMSKLHHPDINENSDSHNRILEINEAYETLGDENKRSIYDQSLLYNQRQTFDRNYKTYKDYDYRENRYQRSRDRQNYNSHKYNTEKRQQYDAKRKDGKRTSSQNNYSKHFKKSSWDDWYQEQRNEYDDLKKKVRNNKRNSRKNEQNFTKQKPPKDQYSDSHHQYYQYVYEEFKRQQRFNNFKTETSSRKKGEANKSRKFTFTTHSRKFSAEDFFRAYDEFIKKKNGNYQNNTDDDDDDSYFDEEFFEHLVRYDDVIKAISKEPRLKNQKEYLRLFLNNFRY